MKNTHPLLRNVFMYGFRNNYKNSLGGQNNLFPPILSFIPAVSIWVRIDKLDRNHLMVNCHEISWYNWKMSNSLRLRLPLSAWLEKKAF